MKVRVTAVGRVVMMTLVILLGVTIGIVVGAVFSHTYQKIEQY